MLALDSESLASQRSVFRLLCQVEGCDGVLTHSLLVFLVKLGILVLDYLAHADLGQLFGHKFLVKKATFDSSFVLNEGGNHFVQVFLTNARRLLALRGGNP